MRRSRQEERTQTECRCVDCTAPAGKQTAFPGHVESLENEARRCVRIDPRHAPESEIDRRWPSLEEGFQFIIRFLIWPIGEPVPRDQHANLPVVRDGEHGRAVDGPGVERGERPQILAQ